MSILEGHPEETSEGCAFFNAFSDAFLDAFFERLFQTKGHVDSVECMCEEARYDYWVVNACNMTALDAAVTASEGLCATVFWR